MTDWYLVGDTYSKYKESRLHIVSMDFVDFKTMYTFFYRIMTNLWMNLYPTTCKVKRGQTKSKGPNQFLLIRTIKVVNFLFF